MDVREIMALDALATGHYQSALACHSAVERMLNSLRGMLPSAETYAVILRCIELTRGEADDQGDLMRAAHEAGCEGDRAIYDRAVAAHQAKRAAITAAELEALAAESPAEL